MTRQDKKTKFAIHIGGGYPVNKSTQSHLYPRTTIVDFLNVNKKNEEEIISFCNNYKYFPRDFAAKGLKEAFICDQEELLLFYSKFTQGKLSNDDIDVLNKYLEAICPQITIYTGKEINEYNRELGGGEVFTLGKESYLFETYKTGSPFIDLFYGLAKSIIKKQDLSQCVNCGKFIKINPAKPSKYCPGGVCENSYKQRRRRRKRKMPL